LGHPVGVVKSTWIAFPVGGDTVHVNQILEPFRKLVGSVVSGWHLVAADDVQE